MAALGAYPFATPHTRPPRCRPRRRRPTCSPRWRSASARSTCRPAWPPRWSRRCTSAASRPSGSGRRCRTTSRRCRTRRRRWPCSTPSSAATGISDPGPRAATRGRAAARAARPARRGQRRAPGDGRPARAASTTTTSTIDVVTPLDDGARAALGRRARRRGRALPARARQGLTRSPPAAVLVDADHCRPSCEADAGGRRPPWRRAGYAGGVDGRDQPTIRSCRSPLAAEHTSPIELGTSIAVAFARNPMTLANMAWDLQAYLAAAGSSSASAARSSRTSPSASRCRGATRRRGCASWSWRSGRSGTRWLNGDTAAVPRRVLHAHADDAVLRPDRRRPRRLRRAEDLPRRRRRAMTEVAGEVGDGFLCHGFTTERYLREVTLPALERGRAKAGKTMDGFEIVGRASSSPAPTTRRWTAAAAGTRQQIAFYGSTPAYRPVLELPRLGRPAGRAQPAVEAGRVGGDGRADRRRDARTRSPSSPPGAGRRPSCTAATATSISRTSRSTPRTARDPDRSALPSSSATRRRLTIANAHRLTDATR